MKINCIQNPTEHLWKNSSVLPELRGFHKYLQSLSYESEPDYGYIRGLLLNLNSNKTILTDKCPPKKVPTITVSPKAPH